MSDHPQQMPAQDTTMEAQHMDLHLRLAQFNRRRLSPCLGDGAWRLQLQEECRLRLLEETFIAGERATISERAALAPIAPDAFIAWFEDLRRSGPGQHDALFPWLAEQATLQQFRWFLSQEIAGEAGFDDLVALTLIKAPIRAKVELARNFWDEMGRGDARGMHGRLLDRLTIELGLRGTLEETEWQALALGNLMVALAINRRYAYHSMGALGIIELTAPDRVACVDRGLQRLGIDARSRRYFTVHASLDIEHARSWNREVLHPLVADDPHMAKAIAEGALMRLEAGRRCFQRYRRVLLSDVAA